MNIGAWGENMVLAWCRLEGETGHAAGRRLLEAACRQQLGCDPPAIAVTARGKPYFPDHPVHFSISHTPKHAFCVLSPTPVGMDAEEKDRPIRPALAQKILSPSELDHYRRAEDPHRLLLEFWVLKEACAKCTGEGLRGYPNHTQFAPGDPRITEIDGCIVAVTTQGE